MSVVSFNKNESNDKIKWLIEVKNNIKRNYKKMFDVNNDMYNSLWQQYVDINERLIKDGMKPIDLPGELDYPSIEEYIIHDIQEDYTEWHKKNFKVFCEMMLKTISVMEEYIKENNNTITN